jgi:hypothetical protein
MEGKSAKGSFETSFSSLCRLFSQKLQHSLVVPYKNLPIVNSEKKNYLHDKVVVLAKILGIVTVPVGKGSFLWY